jgi:hypothetical protein
MAYTPYTPTTYPSGTGVFDIFNFSVAQVTGGSSVSMDCKFSNPFVILGGYNNSTGEFLTWKNISQNICVFLGSIGVNSGILRQQDVGGTITELGAAISYPQFTMPLFQLTDEYTPGKQLTTDGGLGQIETISQPVYHSNFQLLELLDRSFDSFAIPSQSQFTFDPGGQDVVLIWAVKRGNNQPFFTLLP